MNGARYRCIKQSPPRSLAKLAEEVEVALDGRGDDVGERGVRTGRGKLLQVKRKIFNTTIGSVFQTTEQRKRIERGLSLSTCASMDVL
jgi:hypothetical protein